MTIELKIDRLRIFSSFAGTRTRVFRIRPNGSHHKESQSDWWSGACGGKLDIRNSVQNYRPILCLPYVVNSAHGFSRQSEVCKIMVILPKLISPTGYLPRMESNEELLILTIQGTSQLVLEIATIKELVRESRLGNFFRCLQGFELRSRA